MAFTGLHRAQTGLLLILLKAGLSHILKGLSQACIALWRPQPGLRHAFRDLTRPPKAYLRPPCLQALPKPPTADPGLERLESGHKGCWKPQQASLSTFRTAASYRTHMGKNVPSINAYFQPPAIQALRSPLSPRASIPGLSQASTYRPHQDLARPWLGLQRPHLVIPGLTSLKRSLSGL